MASYSDDQKFIRLIGVLQIFLNIRTKSYRSKIFRIGSHREIVGVLVDSGDQT